MAYVMMFLLGLLGGGFCVFLALATMRQKLRAQKQAQDKRDKDLSSTAGRLDRRARELDESAANLKAEQSDALGRLDRRARELDESAATLKAKQSDFDARAITYNELQDENGILKRDLQNIDVNLRKLRLDHHVQQQRQEELDRQARELGGRYLKENVKWISNSLTPSNFVNCKQRLKDVIERCRGIGLQVSDEDETQLQADLKAQFERIVRAAFEREEQARIRAQIREEQKLEKEIDRELSQLDRERTAIQAALAKAIADAKEEYSAEVERLKARLAEAEEKTQRALSRAQMTKSGHVYVISNIGSFGEGVFKIGVTRRLEPEIRVRELGDASVPFPFDVHMMISSDDAPSLENALHRALHRTRLNRINPRKEFFRTDIESVRKIVEQHHAEVQYVADPEALEYHQSLDASDEDSEYIESVYESLEEESPEATED
ncbi:MAG TPA: GIY-YIG nuclease family protein [Phycisphaerae bacterium]|nr:GIY-YIG nuclease family protein [Phycisphaerae bacterium]